MPDHVINRITFGPGESARAAFQAMLREVQKEDEPLGSIDFNKLIPMPPELNIASSSETDTGLKLFREYLCEAVQVAVDMPDAAPDEWAAAMFSHLESWQKQHDVVPKVWELGKEAYRNIQKYGCPTWREWYGLNWGAKRNAYQCIQLDETADTMEFQTADCAVPKIVAALSKRFPSETVTYTWSGVEMTQDLGQMVFRGGEAVRIDIPNDEPSLACAMSSGVWRFGAKEGQTVEDGQRRKKTERRRGPER